MEDCGKKRKWKHLQKYFFKNNLFHHWGAKVKNIIISPYDYTVEVTNRFQGLDLMDRVPKELWTEVRDIAEEAVIRTIPKKKKCKKAKWLSEEALQIAVKRREAKGKGE